MSGTEFVLSVTQPVISAFVQRVTSSWWNVLTARHKAGLQSESLGGSTEQRQEAYAQLRWSVIQYRTSIAILVESPPRLVGALWSVPVYLRLLHRLPDMSSEVLDRLLAVHTVGRPLAIEAADSLLTKLATAVDVYSATTGDGRIKQASTVRIELAKVDVALAEFSLVVRGDLGFGDVKTQK